MIFLRLQLFQDVRLLTVLSLTKNVNFWIVIKFCLCKLLSFDCFNLVLLPQKVRFMKFNLKILSYLSKVPKHKRILKQSKKYKICFNNK